MVSSGVQASDRVRSEEPESLGFEQLYRHYFHLVRGYFLRQGLPVEEAEELTQETFLNAFRARADFRGEAHDTTWLLVIAHNLFANYVRARRAAKRDAAEVSLEMLREQGEPPAELRTSGPDALEEALEIEKRRHLARAVGELPQRTGQVMRMAFVHGLKYREIADLLGIKLNTVKSLVFQGKRMLRGIVHEFAPDLNLDLGGNDDEC